MHSAAGRVLTCASYDAERWRELRVQEGETLMRSRPFRGADADMQASFVASYWHSALLALDWQDVPREQNDPVAHSGVEGT
jgi:hypothetical protein